MNDELHRWLDGEIDDDDLPAELRAEAERWRALLDTRREVGPAPGWLEGQVMRNLPARRPGVGRRVLQWVVRPRTVQLRPVTVGGLAVAAVLALLLIPGERAPELSPDTGPTVQATSQRDADGRVYVQFMYVAPEAGTVAVAGDFNDWSGEGYHLEDGDGDGIWTGSLPISPGLHKYMFVVDGEWTTDPEADRYVDDGFGNRNALIEVAATGSAI
jgi:hypothetical protein